MYMTMPITFDSTPYKFRPHLGKSYVLHGNKNYKNIETPLVKVEWGITCLDDDSCTYDLKQSSTVYYDGNSWSATSGTTYFSLSGEQPETTKDPMPITLVYNPFKDQDWIFNNAGVLGLAPTSPLWKYLFNQFDFTNDSVSMQFYITSSRNNLIAELFQEQTTNPIFEGSYLRLTDGPEPEVTSERLNFVTVSSEKRSADYWVIDGMTVALSNNLDNPLHSNVQGCFSSVAKETIISSKFGTASESVMNQLCSNPRGCTGFQDFSRAPDIIVTYLDDNKNEVKITIPPQQYLYQASSGNVGASFGDASEYEALDCPPGM